MKEKIKKEKESYPRLKKLISEDNVLLLVHKKYKGFHKLLIYCLCGISFGYFKRAYKMGKVILELNHLDIRIGMPTPWQKIFSAESQEDTKNNTAEMISENSEIKEKIRKLPVTPWEVVKRIPEIPKVMRWSRKKHLWVSGPEFFGLHHFYIDKDLKHAVIFLKADFTAHVFIGSAVCAEEWRKYDKEQNILFSQTSIHGGLEWKIYQDMVLYRGKALGPKDRSGEPYSGRVVKVEDFNEDINDEWIVSKIEELYQEKK